MKKPILGALVLAIPFIGLFIFCGMLEGWLVASIIWGGAIFVAAMIVIGTGLLTGNL